VEHPSQNRSDLLKVLEQAWGLPRRIEVLRAVMGPDFERCDVVSTLMAALAHKEELVIERAAWCLGELRVASAVPKLLAVLQSNTFRKDAQPAAAEALAKIGTPEAMAALIETLKDQEQAPWVRSYAVNALGAVQEGKEVAVPPLLEAFCRDPNFIVRGMAASALGCLGPTAASAVPALRQALRDRGSQEGWEYVSGYTVRNSAARALGHLGPAAEEAIPDLIAALGDEDGELREAAADSLMGLGEKAADALGRALKDGNERVRSKAVLTLQYMRTSARAAVRDLAGAVLFAEDDWLREQAARALAHLGPAAEEAVPALKSALGDEVRAVSYQAGLALFKIEQANLSRSRRFVQRVRNCCEAVLFLVGLKRSRTLPYLLGEFGPDAVPGLVQALRDLDSDIRMFAALNLGYMGSVAAPALPALRRALADRNLQVRETAGWALGQIMPAAPPQER
jgi:HEAT repeat protein